MNYSPMDTLPTELLAIIAAKSPGAYRGLLTVRRFADTLDYVNIKHYQSIFFVDITREYIQSVGYHTIRSERGYTHATTLPAIVCENGTNVWFQDGQVARDDGPAITLKNNIAIWCLYGQVNFVAYPREMATTDASVRGAVRIICARICGGGDYDRGNILCHCHAFDVTKFVALNIAVCLDRNARRIIDEANME